MSLLFADRLPFFEGEDSLKACHGIWDLTSKEKAKFQSLLWNQALTCSDTPFFGVGLYDTGFHVAHMVILVNFILPMS